MQRPRWHQLVSRKKCGPRAWCLPNPSFFWRLKKVTFCRSTQASAEAAVRKRVAVITAAERNSKLSAATLVLNINLVITANSNPRSKIMYPKMPLKSKSKRRIKATKMMRMGLLRMPSNRRKIFSQRVCLIRQRNYATRTQRFTRTSTQFSLRLRPGYRTGNCLKMRISWMQVSLLRSWLTVAWSLT